MKTTAEMIKIMQAYTDGELIEIYDGNKWSRISHPRWHWGHNDYRIALIPDSINWDHVAPNFKYLARDADGEVFLFQEKPTINNKTEKWDSPNWTLTPANYYSSYNKGTVDWKDSLVKRPE